LAAQARCIDEVAHRPWPLPAGPWAQAQTWCDVLFAHWPVPVAALRPAVPPEIPIDTFDGFAWVAVTPFEVRDMRPRGMSPIPLLSVFGEVNVRTYTTIGGRPGVWFLSLDAASALAVAGGRGAYRLPYVRAAITIAHEGERVTYTSRRSSGEAALRMRYWPLGPVCPPERGTLEHFLTERYCLYALHDGRLLRADIHHRPWPLRVASADFTDNTMTVALGIPLPDAPPLLHYAARQDAVMWSAHITGDV
jgi:uncharacterized protein YqjF (DUF2071 family)